MYHYEALGDERFQEFCQALVAASFPTAQLLPVGQPDGGRDAFVLSHPNRETAKSADQELIVFQVKYVKNSADSRSQREMIEEVIKKEKAKVEKLKSNKTLKYYLITNLQGTAHPEVGSIDRVNDQLATALGIEAYCWWRDDIDRRLDNHSSIKWSYPDILKASDLLERLISGQLGEDEERRRGAIRAYMTAQYDDDQELKFKQTELRSTMTDLFVDLPMGVSPDIVNPNIQLQRRLYHRHIVHAWNGKGVYYGYGQQSYNSAEYFLTETQGGNWTDWYLKVHRARENQLSPNTSVKFCESIYLIRMMLSKCYPKCIGMCKYVCHSESIYEISQNGYRAWILFNLNTSSWTIRSRALWKDFWQGRSVSCLEVTTSTYRT
jgi:hypothetical protein